MYQHQILKPKEVVYNKNSNNQELFYKKIYDTSTGRIIKQCWKIRPTKQNGELLQRFNTAKI